LPHLDFKIPIGVTNVDRASGKCIGDPGVQLLVGANPLNCPNRSSEIGPVAREDWRAGADLTSAGGSIAVGAEVVVEPPRPHALPRVKEPWRRSRVTAMRQHAVICLEVIDGLPPYTVLVANFHLWPDPFGENIGPLQCESCS
jgi:hypothetical protein